MIFLYLIFRGMARHSPNFFSGWDEWWGKTVEWGTLTVDKYLGCYYCVAWSLDMVYKKRLKW